MAIFSATFLSCGKNDPVSENSTVEVNPAVTDSLIKQITDAGQLLFENNYDSAFVRFQEIADASLKAKVWKVYTRAMIQIAALYSEREQYEYALHKYLLPVQDTLDKYSSDNYPDQLLIYANTIPVMAETGRINKALEVGVTMDSLLQKEKNRLNALIDTTKNEKNRQVLQLVLFHEDWTTQHLLSILYLKAGKTQKAGQYLENTKSTLSQLISANPASALLYPLYLSKVGNFHEHLGNLDSAEYYYHQAFNLAAETGNAASAETDTYNLGIINRKRKKIEEAIKWFEQSLDITRQIGESSDRSDVLTHLQLARTWYALGNKPQAMTHIRRAIAKQSVNYSHESSLDINPSASEILHDLRSVEALYLKARYMAEDCFDRLNTQPCQATIATGGLAFEIVNDLKHVLHTSELALSIVDSLLQINFFAKEETEFSLADSASALYENAVHVAFLLAELEPERAEFYHQEAWKYSEANKYNLLFYGIQRGEVERFGKVPADSIIRERILAENRRRLETEIFTRKQAGENLGENAPVVAALASTEAAWNNLEKYYQQTFPDYYELRFGKNDITIPTVQQKLLKKNEAMLEYLSTGEAIYAFLITPDTVVTFSTCGVPDSLIENFRMSVSGVLLPADNAGKDWKYNHIAIPAHKLYTEILQPATDILKNLSDQPWRLHIVRDGKLNYLNFNTFLSSLPPANEETLSPWEYVVMDEKITINYQYSAAIAFRESKRKSDTQFIANYAGFAPWPVENELEYSRKTVRTVKNHLGYSSRAYTSPKSPGHLMEVFLDKGAQFKICHISTHGKADASDPAFSSILFSAADSLTAQIIYESDFPNQQIILDACETGVGKSVSGEGILSLDRAFTFAGAHSVMMSLWQVEDAAAGVLMEDYFENLKKGSDRDLALKQAQMQYVRSQGNNHPFYWAAMVTIGDHAPISLSSSRLYGYILVGLVMGVLLAMFFFRRRRQG
ncbi:MAG: CHAT domain-containing tetratricopeptide repeat protein [Bacteroidia bacterium]